MEQKIKMVVTDLDDTLLSPEKEISPEAVSLIERLEQSGVLFTFITGRPAYAVERFADRVKITAPIVSCNGAVIFERGTGKILSDLPMPTEAVEPLTNRAAELGLTVLVYAGGVEYALSETNWTRVRKAAGRELPITAFGAVKESGKPVYKLNIMADGNTDAFESLTEEIQSLREKYCVALYGNTGCEIVSREANKKTGLQLLCGVCGIPIENVLAVGDNANDQEMLKAAGIGAVVANGTEETKKFADYVCTASYTGGVVEAIEAFVYGRGDAAPEKQKERQKQNQNQKLKLSTSTNIYFERRKGAAVPMEETLRQCARAGFQYLDFGFAELAFVSKRFGGEDWQQELLEYRELAKELGLQFVQAHAAIFDYCSADPDYDYGKWEELFQRSIRGAELLQVPWLVMHPSSYIVNGRIHPDTHGKNVAFLKKYAAVAAEHGVGLAVENMWGRTLSGEKPYGLDPRELLRLMEDVDCRNVGICWDVEHGSIEKLEQREALRLLKDYIVATHISDEAGRECIHTLPYLGNADWDEILGALAEIRYSGVFNFEIQHYLPGVPEELVPSAMRFAYETGMQLVERLCGLA